MSEEEILELEEHYDATMAMKTGSDKTHPMDAASRKKF